jgi:hypothetical protein
MRKSLPYSFALALAAVLALALLLPSAPSSAKGPKPIPQECEDPCRLLLTECILQYGQDDNHCISVYRSCIARCKK